jgi:hypothetical protein
MKSSLAVLAHGLRCNVVAGARLAAFLPVRPFDFRVSPVDFAVLVAFVGVVAFAASFVRGGWPGYLNFGAIPLLLAEIPLVLAACVLVAAILGRRELVLGLGTALFALDPVFAAASLALGSLDARLARGTSWLRSSASSRPLAYAARVRRLAGRAARRCCVVTTLFRFVRSCRGRAAVLPTSRPSVRAAPSIVDKRFFHRQQQLRRRSRLERERPGRDLLSASRRTYSWTFARELGGA